MICVKKTAIKVLIIFLLCPFLIKVEAQNENGRYELKQVLILGRHHVRAPLSTNGSIIREATNKEWPEFDVHGGWLTTKGGVLASYMGDYTRMWLKNNGLLEDDICPDPSQFYAYTNSMQRTVATAQFFIAGAFPACNIPVVHTLELGNMDRVFNPSVNNGSEEFRIKVEEAMTEAAAELDLIYIYKTLDKISDYKNSTMCLEHGDCSLAKGNKKNIFTIKKGEEPSMEGPLRVANSLIDAFSMQYYEGLDKKSIAWGKLKSEKKRKKLLEVINGYEKVLFTSGDIAKDLASPLISYVDEVFNDTMISESNPLVTLMIGHDSNIATLLHADLP